MKIFFCIATLSLAFAVAIFTNHRVVQTEARKTRNAMPGMLMTPAEGGISLINRIDNLDAGVTALNRRLMRLEERIERITRVDSTTNKEVETAVRAELAKVAGMLEAIATEQLRIKSSLTQLERINSGLSTIGEAINQGASQSMPPEEIVSALEWLVKSIKEIESYFPPLYDFLGAVYTGDGQTFTDYASVDLRLNELLLVLDKVREDAAATRELVTPYVIETGKRPRPFEIDENSSADRLRPLQR
jgi:hypothetical protein